jgi:serine/threonine protein kinase
MASDPPKSDSEPFEQTQDAPARSDSAGSKRSAHAKLPQTEHKAKTPIDTGGVGSGSGSGFGTELHFIDGDPKSIPSDKNGLLFGKYKKLKDDPLGGGGMAFIWLVEHVELGQRRALKTITSEIAENPSNRQRFKQEAQILATLSRHPNAVTVYDTKMVGKHAYIEMDYLEGKTLREFFEPETPVALSVVLEILGQICDVLSEAHAAGIIHRDIKPHNIMVVPDLSSPIGQRVKVLDFGIAKRLNEPDPDGGVLTRPNQVLGTVSYASPEQLGLTLDGKKAIAVDSRSDIYSLGILLYELLAGTRPFEGPYTKVWYDHVNTPAPAIAERAPSAHVPAAVEAVVLSCLEKNPAKRPQSARELFQKFQSAVRRAAFEELSDEKTPVGEGPEDIPADPNGNLFGKYRVIRLLGGGGMASVWLVEHIRLKRKCALKVIRSAVARNPANRLRFQREAEILAKLSKHPNAVPVYDTDMEGGYAYIEMDYLEGKTLKDYFPPSTPAPLDKAIWILGDLCSVLSAAHDLGIVHRDIKPQNIMIVPDATAPAGERVKMLDFGIAKITEQNPSDLASLTQMNTSAYVGTYAYSSPEQLGQTWDGQKEPLIDHRSDVYSLGILLYEMLGGIRPFSGPQTKLHFDHVYTPAPAFAERAAEGESAERNAAYLNAL